MQVSSNKLSGFTIVELLVVITVLGILMALVFGTLGDFYQSNTASLNRTTQDTDTRSVLRAIENELTNTSGFSSSYPATGPAVFPLGSRNDTTAWSYLGNDSTKPNNRVLIANSYATDKATSDSTRNLVFVNGGAGCSPGVALPMRNVNIYFAARDSTNAYNLYRRTIVNTSAGIQCSTPFQKQSCASSGTGSATLNPLVCKTTDAVLLRNIDTFDVKYYQSPNDSPTDTANYDATYNTNTSVITQAAREANINNAKTIKIVVTTTQRINGTLTPVTSNIRISKPY